MTKLDIERSELCAFSADVRADAARSLHLLRDIEHTLSWLYRLTAQLRADADFAKRGIEVVRSFVTTIDVEDALCERLEEAQAGVKELFELLIDKRQAGRDDSKLTEEDGIEGAYTDAIGAAADLNDNLNALRWEIMEHDVDMGSPHEGKVLRTPEEVEAFLSTL